MAEQSSSLPINILLVDDNPGDIRLTMEALKEGNVCHQLRIARNCSEALAILRCNDDKEFHALPDIILLDVNLPDTNGLEILAEIKADDKLKKIPVVMLTTSDAERDIQTAYDLHANCYIVKPVELDKFIQVVKSLESFRKTSSIYPTSVRGPK